LDCVSNHNTSLIIYIVLRFFLGELLVTKPTEIPPLPLIDNATYTVSIVD
jgi:hypothetical protein